MSENNTTTEEQYISISLICRTIFYTPIIIMGCLLSSIAYDYVTFIDENDNTKEKKTEINMLNTSLSSEKDDKLD